jgi:hypothetical protein
MADLLLLVGAPTAITRLEIVSLVTDDISRFRRQYSLYVSLSIEQ